MLFNSTARRRPSLSSSVAANSFSARALATISRPSVSVSRIGSVTELMIVKNSARSRRSLRELFARHPRPRICSIFWPRTGQPARLPWASPVWPAAAAARAPSPSVARAAQRDRGERSGAQRRHRDACAGVAVGTRCGGSDGPGRAAAAPADRACRTAARKRDRRPRAGRRSRRSRRAAGSVSTARQTDCFTPAVAGQPFEAGLGAAGEVFVVNEEVLEQLEPCEESGGRDRCA